MQYNNNREKRNKKANGETQGGRRMIALQGFVFYSVE